jgi:hypothetical protein
MDVAMSEGVTPGGSGLFGVQTWSTAEGAATNLTEIKIRSADTRNGTNEQQVTDSSKIMQLIFSNDRPTLTTGGQSSNRPTKGRQTVEHSSAADNAITEAAVIDNVATGKWFATSSSTQTDDVSVSNKTSLTTMDVAMSEGVTPGGSGLFGVQTWSTAEGAATNLTEIKIRSADTRNGTNEQQVTDSSKIMQLIFSNDTPTLTTGGQSSNRPTTGRQTVEHSSAADNVVTVATHLPNSHNDKSVTKRSIRVPEQVI